MARSHARTERGAAAVEFAIVLIPLMVLVAGILSYGFLLSFRQSVSQAAAEASRAIAIAPVTADRQAIAFDAINNVLHTLCNTGALSCTVSTPASCSTCMSVTVSWDYAHDASKPKFAIGFMLPDTLAYTSTTAVNQAGSS
jgi:Flp pilus assembly protein TadG